MDLVASCKDKLAYFRIKELKDVLTQLGLSKQGKKQDLVERILATLSDEPVARIWAKKNTVGKEEVAKLVEDTYRKMQVSGATDLASKGQNVVDGSIKIKGEIEVPFSLDTKVCCPCGSSLETDSMIKCEGPRCQVRQHVDCVIIPEKPMENDPQLPDLFYCEVCRLSRADPFWVTVAHPLYPVKLATTNIPTDGSNPVQVVEKTFQLTRADRDLLAKQEYDVQAWCMLLNDKVPFRMQWPQFTDLQVNGVPIRAINRPGSQLLGVNGRDDGPIITPCTRDGINKISLTGCDARIFCLGVRIVKRRTIQQILNLIPRESDGEQFEEALTRVCRCVGGGTTDNADSDSDLEVVADSFTVSLRCPMSGSRMKVAGRFKPCAHMGCFDLEVFVELNQRSRKWQCPICLKNYSLENIIIDPYFNRITSKMSHCGEDVTEIEVKSDGSWRVKTKSEAERRDVGEPAQWHNPDSTLCASNGGEINSNMDMMSQIKKEGVPEGHTGTGLKLGIRKNRNGFWEVSKPEDLNPSSYGNKFQEKFENHEQKIIPMSSSATGSGRDGEDPSVNQDGGGNFEFPNNGLELDSLSLNVDSAYGFADRNASAPDAEIIVLSDSDDDNNLLMSSGIVYNNRFDDGGAAFSVSAGMVDTYPEDPTLGHGNLLYNANDNEFMPLWSLPSGTHGAPGFQLFSSDMTEQLGDLQHGSVNCPTTTMNGYTLASETVIGTTGLVPDSSVSRTEADMNDGLVDNPLAFGGEDPSLQIFLPTRSSDASLQPNLRDQIDPSNGIHTEDWISLSLGGATSSNGESVPRDGINPRGQMSSGECGIEPLADAASLLPAMNDRSEKASRQRSDSPFSFPRQKRSVRQRLYLSIDSDSD